jgi:hypothetical protein
MNRYAMTCLLVGSRTHGRDTFLCAAKEKYPKERPPGCRFILRAGAFGGRRQKGLPAPLPPRFIHEAPLFGLNPPKAPVLGATNGNEKKKTARALPH